MIKIFDKKETEFDSLGLGVLSPISCTITEVLNGMYELTMVHPYDTGDKWKRIENENIILAETPSGVQPFRIYNIAPTMKEITVKARHIFYDLLDNMILNADISGDSSMVLIKLSLLLQYETPFKFYSNIGREGHLQIQKTNPVNALIGEGMEFDSFLSVFGGELKRDFYVVRFLESLGTDRGLTVSYGKNLIGLEIQEDFSEIATRVYPMGFDGLTISSRYIDSPLIDNYVNPKIRILSDENLRTEQELIDMANDFFEKGGDMPTINIKVNFQELSQTAEYCNYQNLQQIYLGDIVTVVNPKMNFKKKSKVISYEYDCLTRSYNKIELGDFLPTLEKTVNAFSNDISNSLHLSNSASGVSNTTKKLLLEHTNDIYNPHLTTLEQVGFLHGTNEPTVTLGDDGMFYMKYANDSSVGALYLKSNGLWQLVLKGAE